MTSSKTNLRAFDQDTMTAPTTTVSVPAHFIETFLVVADFCLQQDPLHNQAVPTNRIKKLWKFVEGGAAWNQQYYQIVRERLHRMGVIRIAHKNGPDSFYALSCP
jgi:ABC-type branched-subunit amino acid transport system substrate-binding protein